MTWTTRRRARSLPGPAIAAAAAASLLAIAGVLSGAALVGGRDFTPQAVVPLLCGLGALCLLGLAAPRSPSVAWLACVATALFAAAAFIPLYADARSMPDESIPVAFALLFRTALLAPGAIALAYAVDPARRFRPWVPPVAWALLMALAVVLVAGFVQLAAGAPADGTVAIPQVLWFGIVAVIAGLGIAGDVDPAVARVREQLRAYPGAAASPLARLRLLAGELLPWSDATHRGAVESERARIAFDLHAEILPSLRRALTTAEAGGSPERLAADLRAAVVDVEDLLVARRSIVLEELGIIPALEWLAERTEERSAVQVVMEVGGDGPERRPPRGVERAAFRIAQLALDNVIRHAPGASVRLSVEAGPARVRLLVEDDGPGLDRAGGEARDGRRGIADMRSEARAIGGELAFERGPDERGTRVRLEWSERPSVRR